MRILNAGDLKSAAVGLGLQQAVLEGVASGDLGPTALVWSSGRFVASTRPETRMPGFKEAKKTAQSAEFVVLVRNSGGAAVAGNRGSLSFSLTVPVQDLRHGLYERYDLACELIVGALRRLGIKGERGEVEGAFCPGAHSVRVGGERGFKVAGLAQRVIKTAARVEALVMVEHTAELAEVLRDFYVALGRPFLTQSVADLGPTAEEVARAITEEALERCRGEIQIPEEALMARAGALCGEFYTDG